MPDKKLTDAEIVKALECCANCESCDYETSNCPLNEEMECRSLLSKNALDLINRLQAENEKYEGIKEQLGVFWNLLLKLSIAKRKEKPTLEEFAEALQEYKAEAYKECVEKVNNIINEIYNKHIFGSNDLSDEEKDAVINFSDDVTYVLNNLLNHNVDIH